MATFPTTLILLSLLFSGLLEVSGDRGAVKLVPTEREFDYFLLTLQWPATFCYSHDIDCTCPQNGCCLGAKYVPTSGFTIHGLWPSYEDSSYPQCCTENAFDNAFNLSMISPILEDIKTYWTLLACSTTSSCHGKENMFWAHEWEKHGTCTAPVLKDQFEYFSKSLELYLDYNITNVLLDAGYVPSDTNIYPSSGIHSALEENLRVIPQLLCKEGAIREVRLCFTKDFKLRDCVENGDCPDNVIWPEFGFVDETKTQRWSIISDVNSS